MSITTISFAAAVVVLCALVLLVGIVVALYWLVARTRASRPAAWGEPISQVRLIGPPFDWEVEAPELCNEVTA